MSGEAAAALEILRLAAELGPAVARGIEDVFSQHRPDLLPAPPPGQMAAIRSEDDAVIEHRFGHSDR